MRKYASIIASLALLAVAGYVAVQQKNRETAVTADREKPPGPGAFSPGADCARLPQFLGRLKIPQPVLIDLSQKRYTGIALHYGRNYEETLHPEVWEKYEHFGTYALNGQGDIYLSPTPFISVRPGTFELQKNIYKLDSKTGALSAFMHFDDVRPSANNPYGVISLAYDCEDRTLWVSAIDETDYQNQKGVIYQVDPETKEIRQRIEGFDALTVLLLPTGSGKFLLAGSARDNALYAYAIAEGMASSRPVKLLELPVAQERIRKIRIAGKNHLELQTIPFSYTLLAQSTTRDRTYYDAKWDASASRWKLEKRE
ncbi:hypothetical protein [Thiolapillus sp.]